MLFLSFLACGPTTPWVNDPMIDVDVNGDGLVDLVGLEPNGTTNTLALQVTYGSPDFFDGVSDLRTDAREPDVELFVTALGHPRHVGDLDGDGTTDIAGACGNGTGEVCVFFGSATGLQEPVFLDAGNNSNPRSPTWIGDVTCDGLADLVAWERGQVGSSSDRSAMFWASEAGGIDAPPVERNDWDDVVVGYGDVDGDGCHDIFVGDNLWLGAPGGPVDSGFELGLYNPQGGGGVVSANQRPFDLNNDGVHDLHLWLGTAGGVPESLVSGSEDLPWRQLQPAGDLDGDGLTDMAGRTLGNAHIDGTRTTDRVLEWVMGKDAGFELTTRSGWNDRNYALYPDITYRNTEDELVETTYENRYFGTVGDIDGDGYSDLVSAGQHFFYLSVLRGGPRFRGEVSAMLPNAGAAWAGVQDNVVH